MDPSSSDPSDSAYARAGVDIAAGRRATELMKAAVQATYTPQVLAGIGAFGGLYAADELKQMNQPVLVASTDGVGTKTRVAARLNRWDTIGHDIVNHCINDILVQGGRPLFFLDYIASSRLDPEQVASLVRSMSAACQAAGCALLGGETAEMPGVYTEGEIDVVGTIIGVVDRTALIDGSAISPDQVILGLPSTGLHTNGFSLARAALADESWVEPHPDLERQSIGEALLHPHRSYLPLINRLREIGVPLSGLAHITGGGIVENLPRVLPEGTAAVIHRGSWPVPPIFRLIQKLGAVSTTEMYEVFNMGLGMLVVVPPEAVSLAQHTLGDELFVVGEITTGSGEVAFDG